MNDDHKVELEEESFNNEYVEEEVTDQTNEPEVPLDTTPFTPINKPVNFKIDKPFAKPIQGKEPSLSECIGLLRESNAVMLQFLEHNSTILERLLEDENTTVTDIMRKRDEIKDTDGNPHLRQIFAAYSNQVQNPTDLHTAALEREGSEWHQVVEVDDVKFGAGIPVQKLDKNGNYSRDELLSYVTRKAGAGTTIDMPLWHSGLWLRFKAPTLSELTYLNQEIANIKVSIGAETRGLAFSNVSHFIKTAVIDFALQHVTMANVSFTTPSDLKELIDIRDVPAIFLAIAATLYPNGYAYATPCVADISKCNHIVKELIQVHNLWWVDTNQLTTWQRRHMAKRIRPRAPKTLEDLETYRNNHQLGGRRVEMLGDIGVVLGCPNLFEHEELGGEWLNGIIEMTQTAFNEPPGGRNRSVLIQQLAESTAAREYSHWVKAIVEVDEDSPEGYRELTDDKTVIADILSSVLSHDEYLEKFNKIVETYIDDSLIAIPAIPSFNCPCCDSPAATEFKKRFDSLIPIDPLTEFFTLGIRKLKRIL